MNNTNNNNERNLLLVDLLRWFNFFKKCHEIETAIPMQDEIKLQYRANNKIEPDITERKIEFGTYEKERYAKVLQDSYIELNPNIMKNYHNNWLETFGKKVEKSQTDYNNQYSLYKKCKYPLLYMLAGFAGQLISIPLITAVIEISLFLIILFGVLGFACIITGFVFAFIAAKKKENLEYSLPYYYKEVESLEEQYNNNYDYDYWINNTAKNLDDLPCSLIEMYKIVEQKICKYHEYLNKHIPELIAIKQDILKETMLPKHYITEQHVCCILSLVLDGRADTLKEGLNLYEEEVFRNTVIRSFDDLSRSINLLHDNIDNISSAIEYNNVNALELNNSITNRLDSIESATNFLSFNAASK